MVEQKTSEKISYNPVDIRNENSSSINPRFPQGPSNSSATMNFLPSDQNIAVGARPVLNYSIQTGEEFALEFMWERVNPRQHCVPSSSSVEANNRENTILGVDGASRAGPNRLIPDASSFPRVEKGNIKNQVTNVSLTSSKKPRSLGLRTRSSMGSFGGTLKFLCSFGGKILPRPSDRKLRYVGGETRILRIGKNISWDELKQKTLAMYNEPHSIRYQLPGEDLDALVSVSCDEDLQNLMEECNLLDDGGGSQKLRVFLISNNDSGDSQLGVERIEGDSDVQYVVAVNGVDFSSRRNSIVTESHLGKNLDELTGQVASRVEPPSLSHAFESKSLSREQPERPLSGAIRRTGILPTAENFVPNYTFEKVVPEEASLVGQANRNLGSSKAAGVSGLEAKINNTTVVQKKNESEKSNSPDIDIPQIDSAKTQSLTEGNIISSLPHTASSLNTTKSEEKGCEDVRDHMPPINVQDENVNKLDGCEISHAPTRAEPDVLPRRFFHSERIPREQLGLNRWSKSDESVGPQFIICHSQSDISQQITGSVHNLAERDEKKNIQDDTDGDKKEPTHRAEQKASVVSEKNIQDEPANLNKMNQNVENGPSEAVSQSKPSLSAGVSEHGDILIDINDRFPQDFLSDIFSKATTLGSDAGFVQLYGDAAGLSVNMVNHEPKRWSYFQNLARDTSGKDFSLMDQDHPTFSSSQPKLGDDDESIDYGYTPFEAGAAPADQRQLSEPLRPDTMNLPSDYTVTQTTGAQTQAAGPDHQDENQAIQQAGFPLLDYTLGHFDPSSLQIIKNSDLEELRELGAGTYGTVYHGKWRGSDVAIKRIKKSCFVGRSSEQERLTAEFWHEAEILSKLHHPNVVAFYGVVQDGPGGTLATVTEFMVNGSLRHVLISKDRHLDRRKRLIIAMDAAFGMEYLHSRNIVHFDLKCDNLLVNLKDSSRPICKVGDFGLSKIKRNTLVTGGVRGTLPWMAPELLNGSSSKVSEKVDVFSFGIVLWEILTGEEPYANMHYGAIIGGIVNNTLRPPVPSFCDPEWRLLMEQCWAPDPFVRPSFTEIAQRLRTMSSASLTKPQGFAAHSNQLPKK
ncbi:Protein kinase superfamily protein with octicosapeptide/Phox/Bem1p domain [Striga hermonthica]|uniref:Protein kinase superfamily protein with octicosapeptide/Phox/Bem1p domain n=1 Tax=Striga hermonthica TaxID=68872 RepID=A0A9N7NJS8_STRHE|nr:Protein kinase superfamily protein with octicosapeptide/Phox/Bem1p domain [Striga hermonthica]